MFADYREPLVEVAAQLLVVLLDHETMQQAAVTLNGPDAEHSFEVSYSHVLHAEGVSVDTCQYQLPSLFSCLICVLTNEVMLMLEATAEFTIRWRSGPGCSKPD